MALLSHIFFMKLLCFLGNVGDIYANTRHNAGWLAADFLAQHWKCDAWKEEKKLFCFLTTAYTPLGKVVLIKPTTYMNNSGKSLQSVCSFFKISIDDILIIYDDKDMEFGKLRYRKNGSAGGQNGMKDCIRAMGTDGLSRIKIGVGNKNQALFSNPADFVLSHFLSDEKIELSSHIFPAMVPMVETWLCEDII